VNAKQRRKNRDTARQLRAVIESRVPCPNCGGFGLHFAAAPYTLEDMVQRRPPVGLYTCKEHK
jgi:hypothetical protein